MTRRPIIHLPIIDDAMALARRVPRAPDPAAPPPVSVAIRRTMFGTVGAMMLLTAAEAGATKAAELDGELLDLCAEYVAWCQADRLAYDVMTNEEREAAALISPVPWSDEAYWTPGNVLMHEIAAIPARTPEGLRAKADVVAWGRGLMPPACRARCARTPCCSACYEI